MRSNQPGIAFELVLIDDGSLDRTFPLAAEIARKLIRAFA